MVHLSASAKNIIEPYTSMVAQLILQWIKSAVRVFGIHPTTIITPYSAQQVEILCANDNNWAIAKRSTSAKFDNHPPKSPLLSFCLNPPVIFPQVVKKTTYSQSTKCFY